MKKRIGMKIMKSTKTAFERQILESVLIQKHRNYLLMNNKAEYNRCALPRLTAKLGERDLEKWREGDMEEMRKEATIEEKIRLRKKEKAKKRAEQTRRTEQGQPKRKRKKLDEGSEIGEAEEIKPEERMKTSAKKRKVNEPGGKPMKKRRENYDIKKFISCKKWKEEEGRKGEHEQEDSRQEELRPSAPPTTPSTSPTKPSGAVTT